MNIETPETGTEDIPAYLKILPIPLLILNLLLFFKWIPNDVADNYSTLFAIVGGVITLVLCFWTVLFVTPKLFDLAPIFLSLLCISSIFIFGWQFISKTVDYSSQELKEYGVQTEATIRDMTWIPGRRGNSIQYMEVAFRTNDNKVATADIDISKNQYRTFSRGTVVPIIYSSKHPSIARLDYSRLRVTY